MMQSVMIEKVFYGVPHHAGYFDDADAPKAEPAHHTLPSGDDNDEYHAVNS